MGSGPDREQVIRAAMAWLSEQTIERGLEAVVDEPALRPQTDIMPGELFHPTVVSVYEDGAVTVPTGVAKQVREAFGFAADIKPPRADYALTSQQTPKDIKPN